MRWRAATGCSWSSCRQPPAEQRGGTGSTESVIADGLRGRAVKTLVLHMSLAHRDWLPLGQLPPGHALTVQHTLHMLLGVGLGLHRRHVAGCAEGPLIVTACIVARRT